MSNLDMARRSALYGRNPYEELLKRTSPLTQAEYGRVVAANSIASGPVFGEGNTQNVIDMMKSVEDPQEMADYYAAGEAMVGADEGKNFLEKAVEVVTPIFETLNTPQQMIFQLATGGDIREAIPEWIAPDSWEAEGVSHEMLSFGDVANIWSNGALDEWYQKEGFGNQLSEAMVKTAFFAGDVFTDPLSYASAAPVVRVLRKTLPLGMQTRLSTKLAIRAQKGENIKTAMGRNKAYREELQGKLEKGPNARLEGELKNAQIDMVTLNRLSADTSYAAARRDVVEFAKGPMTKQKNGPKVVKADIPRSATPKKVPTAEELVAAEKQLQADRMDVRNFFNEMEDEVWVHNRAIKQPTDEQLSDAVADLVLGVESKNTWIRTPKVTDETGSTNLGFLGVGKRGTVNALDVDNKEAITLVSRQIDRLNKRIIKATNDPNVLKKDIKALNKELKGQKLLLKELNEKGITDKTIGGLSHVLPGSYRRTPLASSNYMISKWGKAAEKMYGVMLYPKALMPQAPGWFSHLFREPTRALQGAAPEMRDRMVGGMKSYQAYQNEIRLRAQSVFREANIYKEKGPTKRAKGLFVHKDVPNVDNEKAAELFHLLDHASYAARGDVGLAEYKLLEDAATPAMLKARGDMRTLLNDMGNKLGVGERSGPQWVEGYVPHFVDMDNRFLRKEWFEKGGALPDWEGMDASKIHFGNLMERTGLSSDVDNIVSIMDAYTRGASRKAYIEPMLRDLKHMAAKRADLDPKQGWLKGFAQDIALNVNGKPSQLSSLVERIAKSKGRQDLIKRSGSSFAGLTYSAALVGNLRYPVMSIVQALNTTSAKNGPLSALRGLAKFATPKGRALAHAANVDTEIMQIYSDISHTTTVLRGSSSGAHRVLDKVEAASRLKLPGTPAIEDTEFFIRGMTFFAEGEQIAKRMGYESLEALGKADKEAYYDVVANAVRSTEEVNHVFGVIGRPVLFSRATKTGASLTTQFFSFPFKQTETLLDIGMQNPGAFVDYLYSAGKIQNLIANELNLDVSRYVGVQYAEGMNDMAKGERVSLPIQVMGDLIKLPTMLLGLANGVQPGEISKGVAQTLKSVEMLFPAKTGIEQRFEAASDLKKYLKGEEVNVRQERRGNIEAAVVSAISGGSFGENKYGKVKHKKSGDDVLSVLTGLQTMKGKVESDVAESLYKRNQKVRATQESLTQAIWDGVRTGEMNTVTLQEHIIRLRSYGIPYKDITKLDDRIAKIRYAATMTTRMREGYLDSTAETRYAQKVRSQIEGRAK